MGACMSVVDELPSVRAYGCRGEAKALGVRCWGGAKAHLLSGAGPGPGWGAALEQRFDRR